MANEFKIRKGLIVTGASGGTVVDIQGSQGQLFSVTDDLSGSIFAVSDISGVPIFDVNSSGLSTFDGPATFASSVTLSSTLPLLYLNNTTASTGKNWRLSSATNGKMYIAQDGVVDAITLDHTSGNATFAGTIGSGAITSTGNIRAEDMFNIYAGSKVLQLKNVNNEFSIRNGNSGLVPLTIEAAGEATFTGLVNGIIPTANANFTTKQYVDGLITGATIYRGVWQAGISATSTGATTASTTLTVSAAILDSAGNTPDLVGAVVTGAGITGTVKVSSVTSATVYVLNTAIDATATAYIFSPEYGAPDLSGVTQTSGYYYICSEAGSATPNGAGTEPNTWSVGDWAIWNDDIGAAGEWQKIDNSSVISGAGTGQKVTKWEGTAGVAGQETLTDGPITFSASNDHSTFAGNIIPDTDASLTLGTGALRFNFAYINNSITISDGNINSSNTFDFNQGADFDGMITVNGGGVDIDNNDDIRLRFDNASTFKAGLQVATTIGDMIADSAVNDFAIRAQENMLFSSGGNTEVLRLDTSGNADFANNVAIGNTTVRERLTVSGKVYIEETGVNWNETTPGTAIGTQHFDPVGAGTDNTGNAITFGASDSGGGATAQAGIYTRTDGTYGTKMYFATTDSYSSGSKTAMMIDYTGDVGIGTTDPDGKFHVYKAAAHNNIYFTGGDVGGTGYDVNLYINGGANNSEMSINMGIAGNADRDRIKTYQGNMYFRTNDSERVIINSGGNVGIGITGPSGRLHVADDDGPTSLYITNTDTAQTDAGDVQNAIIMKGLYWSGSATSQLIETRINSVHQIANGNGGSALTFMTQTGGSGAVEQVRIDKVGNVGIGTTSPRPVGTGYKALEIGSPSSGSSLWLSGFSDTTKGYLAMDTGGLNLTAISNHSLTFGTNNSPKMTILSGGNVGIATTVPQTKLAIGSAQGSGIDFLYDATNNYKHQIKNYWNSNTDSRMDFNIGRTSGVTPVTIMSVGYGGNVGIGTTTPLAKLDVQGTQGQLFSVTDDLSGSIFAVADISGVPIFDVNSSGVSYFDGYVGIGTSSPITKLHVRNPNKNNDAYGLLLVENIDGDTTTSINSGVNVKSYYGTSQFMQWENNGLRIGSRILTNGGSGNLYFTAGGDAVKMVVLAGGNVGIGVTGPTAKLEVTGNITKTVSISQTRTDTSTSLATMRSFNAFEITQFRGGVTRGLYMSNITDNLPGIQVVDSSDNSGPLSIQPFGGYVGIGTTAPGAKLEVSGNVKIETTGVSDNLLLTSADTSASSAPDIVMYRTAAIADSDTLGVLEYRGKNGMVPSSGTPLTYNALYSRIVDASANQSMLTINTNKGNGTGAFTQAVHIAAIGTNNSATGAILINPSSDFALPAYNLDVSGNGRFTSTVTATNFILSSDKTLKDNIRSIDNNHIDVNWKNFELKSEPGIKRSGVIAQELEEKHPEFVRTNKEGLKSVAYIDLLIAKIAELEARLEKAGI